MQLTKAQVDILSHYFADLSKILFASTVVGFFIPSSAGPISFSIFIGGSMVATVFILFSLKLVKLNIES